MRRGAPGVGERLASFLRRELAPNERRMRAFGRTLAGLVMTAAAIQIFKPENGYWAINFALLVSSPLVGHSGWDAVRRVLAALVGALAAGIVVIVAYDLPWLYVPLQSLGVGAALFLVRATPVGSYAITAATTFAVITGGSREVGATGLINLAWVRLGLAVLGSTLGAIAQLALWREDALGELRRALRAELGRVEDVIAGRPAVLDPGSVGERFELLANAEVRDPSLAQRRAEITLLILEVARLVDQASGHPALTGPERERSRALLADACGRLRRSYEAGPFERFPAPPPPTRGPRWPSFVSPNVQLARHAAMKTAISAFVCLFILDAMQLPGAGGLLVCIVVGLSMSTGSDDSKLLTLLGGLAVAMAVTLLEARLAAPNVDDVGSWLIVVALTYAPTAWAVVAGPRVRNPGLVSTVLVTVGLLQGYRPSDDLGPSATFLVSLCVGCLVFWAVDRAVWPVSRDLVQRRQLAVAMRSSADLMDDRDPRMVLAPASEARWSIHRNLRGIADLRGEKPPLPETPEFEEAAERLRLAAETQRRVVARIDQARRELAGDTSREDAEQRRIWSKDLRARADAIEDAPRMP